MRHPLAPDRFVQFGYFLGATFQIQDDILDIVGDVETVGKTLGIDVEKGKMTLPMIHFLRTAPREHRELLAKLVDDADPGVSADALVDRITAKRAQ